MEQVKKQVGLVFWFTLAGILVSAYLLLLHLEFERFGATCSINQTFSCSVLLIKKYSLWFGVPVPIYSLMLYGLSFIISIYAYRNFSKNLIKPILYLYALSLISLGASIGMAFVSFFVLKTICIFCSLLYVISILFFLWMNKIFQNNDQPWFYYLNLEFKNFYKNKTTVKVLAGLMVLWLSAFFVFHESSSKSMHIHGDETGKILGNANAQDTIEVFSDFQCPACKTVTPFIYEIERELGSQVKIIHRSYPLDPSCNSAVRQSLHAQACNASVAGYCASLQGKFWRYHDLLFEYQHALNSAKYLEIAKVEGLKIQAFMDCIQSSDALIAVQNDIAQGNLYGVNATPSIFINGKLFQESRTIENIKNAIEK